MQKKMTKTRLLTVEPYMPVTTLLHDRQQRFPSYGSLGVEDIRQTELLKEAWEDSGKVYGYRKLHDDLQDQGETCCPNRVARLTRMAGIKAHIGYKRRAATYGGKPFQNAFRMRNWMSISIMSRPRAAATGAMERRRRRF